MGKGRMLLGVDLGSYTLKVLQLGQSEHGLELEGIAMAAYPEGTFADGHLRHREAVVNTLSMVLAQINPDCKQAAISVGGPSTFIKHLTLPVMCRADAIEQVRAEGDQYFSWDQAEMVWDLHIMSGDPDDPGDSPESGGAELENGATPGTMDVLLTGVKKNLVEDRIRIVREAGLEPVIVDLDVFAVVNAYKQAAGAGSRSQGGVLLLNGGASVVNMGVFFGRDLVFTRDLTMGGDLITEVLENRFQVGYEVAEEAKLSRTSFTQGGDWWSVEGRLIQPVVKSMVGEILKSVNFFSDDHPHIKIHKVVVSGGLARCSLFREVLRTMVGLPVEVFNPFANLILGTDELVDAATSIGPAGAVGVGLALRQRGERAP